MSNNQCVGSGCSSGCRTCSDNPAFCLSCDEVGLTPIVNLMNGTCVASNVNGCPDGFFVNKLTFTCD